MARTPAVASLVLAVVMVSLLPAAVVRAQTNSTTTSSSIVQVDHRALIWTMPGWDLIDFLETTMQGYDIPYTVLRWSTNETVNVTSILRKPSGDGAFSGIIMFPSMDVKGFMTRQQVQDLQEYTAATKTRIVRWGVWPWNHGYQPVPTVDCTNQDQLTSFTADAPMGISGVRRSAKLSMFGLYRCPGQVPGNLTLCSMFGSDFATTGIIVPCNTTTVMTYDPLPSLGASYTEPTMAAALVSYNAGNQTLRRDELVFTMSCARWQVSCLVMSHFSLSWLMHDLIPGHRRALLKVQVDDAFISTPLNEYDMLSYYTANITDYIAHEAWQTQVSASLPAGSDIRIDMVYNGNGILDDARDPNYIFMGDGICRTLPLYDQLNCTCLSGLITFDNCTHPTEWCRNCTKDWKMPLNSGANIVPGNTSAQWWDRQAILVGSYTGRTLITNRTLTNAFLWTSHSFTHQNMNNATYADCLTQWGLNKEMAELLNLTSSPGYSSAGVVTPQISGFSNANCLKALTELGYVVGVGDNTWPYLNNPNNAYHMLQTTQAMSNWDGYYIIPRFATEIYYNSATQAGNVGWYNKMYLAFYGRNSTMAELLEREATRAVRDQLLALRYDPHMMHQANLGRLDGPKSLLMLWMEAVLNKLQSFVAWPVQSLKMDTLFQLFLDREKRDNCGITYTLRLDPTAGQVVGIHVRSENATVNGTCSAPIMYPVAATLSGVPLTAGPPAGQGVDSEMFNITANGAQVNLTATGLAW